MTLQSDIFTSAALADILAERLAQVTQRGHTPESDADQPVHRLLDLTSTYARIACDRAAPGDRQTLAGARKKAVQAAALAIAAVERLDLDIRAAADAAPMDDTLFDTTDLFDHRSKAA